MQTKEKAADSATNTINGKEKSLNSILTVENQNVNKKIVSLISELGIPPHIIGFDCIVIALQLICSAKKRLSMTKEVYPTVAQSVGINTSSAERAIRYAVYTALKTKDSRENVSRILGAQFICEHAPNSKFLYICALKIKE